MEEDVLSYTQQLEDIKAFLSEWLEIGGFIEGALIFFIVVILCYFGYRFFRLFF